MQQAEVVFVSPATGGIAVAKDIHFLATAASAAREHTKKLANALGIARTDITVFTVVALQTRGMLCMKMLDHIRLNLLMDGMGGPIMIVYPMIPRAIYSGKRTHTVGNSAASTSSSGPSMAMALSPASGGTDIDGDSSQEDDFDEDGQLPEVISRGSTLMTQWQRAAALSKDCFVLDSKS